MIAIRARRLVAVWVGTMLGLGSLLLVSASFSRADPFQAAYIDNQVHSIGANADLWFKFDYGMSGLVNSVVSLNMLNGSLSGVRYDIWAPADVGNWMNGQPAGRGAAALLDCATGYPSPIGACRSTDVTWSGSWASPGTYYVHVINDTSSPAVFQLVIQGAGISLGPIAPNTPVLPFAYLPSPVSIAPTPIAIPVTVDDPTFAAAIDGQAHGIGPNAGTWYKFDYRGADYSSKPRISLRLVNGVQTGVRFEVWAGENIKDWWERKPAGQGTQEVLLNCWNAPPATATPVADEPLPTEEPFTPTKCRTNDLTWFGAFGAFGTYYVRVVNDTGLPESYVLTMQQ